MLCACMYVLPAHNLFCSSHTYSASRISNINMQSENPEWKSQISTQKSRLYINHLS